MNKVAQIKRVLVTLLAANSTNTPYLVSAIFKYTETVANTSIFKTKVLYTKAIL